MTGDSKTKRYQILSFRHFERKREIFVIRGLAVNVWKFQTGNLLSKRLSGIAPLCIVGTLKFESRDV